GDGMAFIHAGGTVIKKYLENETLRLDTGCLVGFSGDIDYSIEMSGGLKSMLLGGEGIFLATLSGTGSVWIQSMPFSRLVERIANYTASNSKEGN
ncbi:MAG: AIM24 family protein, partial [Pseudomonadota bacterium]